MAGDVPLGQGSDLAGTVTVVGAGVGGMLRYWLHRDDNDPAHIMRYEHWADRADFEASLHAAWREDYIADTEHLWATPRVVTTYRMIDTPWEPFDDGGLPASLGTTSRRRDQASR